MNRVKLEHGYHDAFIRSLLYTDDAAVILEVDLCGCCNPSPGAATLGFVGVRNFREVKEALESARKANSARGYIDEIIGIRRDGREYLVDLDTAGGLRVDAKGLIES